IFLFIFFFTILFPGEASYHVGPITFHFGVSAIAHFADFMLLAGLIAVNFAVVRSRQKYPDYERPFTVPAVPYVPIVAVLANLVLLVNVEPGAFVFGVLAELVGAVLWVTYVGEPSEERLEEETPTVVEERRGEERDYRIVVPIANPDHIPQLMRTADDLASVENGEVIVTSVVTLPEQTPLSEGYQYAEDRREVLERAMSFAEERDIPVSGTVRIGHHVDEAILNTVRQYDADAVLMGWSGSASRRRDIVLGSIVDEVVREAPCDVLVERIGEREEGDVESILVPTAGGPHSDLAAEVAGAVARAEDATVTALTVVDPGATESQRTYFEDVAESTRTLLEDVDVETRVEESDDVADAIVESSAEYDLTVMGATQEGLLQEFVFGAVPEEVARRAPNLVIMTKRNLGVASRLRQWLRWK
ncbi:MAG: universal stress protein, partial [Haloarculaceae archaeon]